MTMRPFHYSLVSVHAALAGALVGLAPQALGFEAAASCPGKIPRTAFVPGAIPAGWTGFVPRPLFLTGAGMMSGPPEALEYLAPNQTDRKRQVYDFQPGDRQRWLWCLYADGVQLSRRLDDDVTRCTVTTTGKIPDGTLAATARCTRPTSAKP